MKEYGDMKANMKTNYILLTYVHVSDETYLRVVDCIFVIT
jgi:hypothetical protein